ncbi:MAG: ATP-binding cassette domain-containing protein [Ruminococcus sp.]|nr:ATP-binding cassette domain-containing protein [Ruminococcus sp.]
MRLEVNNLIYRYHKKALPVLEEISFSMTNEERVGVAAPSGRGKTTLCKLIGGYLVPEQGEILLDGKSVMEYRGYCPIQMIWQQPELAVNPRLRMKEVLAEGDQIAERVIHGMGIEEDWLERFPTELSGGELQRFLIARALGQRTRFLLMDEITAMLDLITQSQIWNFLLQEVQERKIGLLVVSHSRPLLNQVCTRMLSVF